MRNDQWQQVRADVSNIASNMASEIARSSGLTIDRREDAPDTWDDLRMAHGAALIDQAVTGVGKLPIYDGHTDKTIYTTADANIMGRFWHDMTHLRLNQDFTRRGETTVARSQLEDAVRMGQELGIPFGRVAQAARLIYLDVVAQVTYAERFGTFPDDQEAFIRDVYENGTTLALMHVAQEVA